ncbi:MAG: DUF1702 family protein [Brachybacterium sp.]|nr:DUF1702 family protein [Brachybacterium sp.]
MTSMTAKISDSGPVAPLGKVMWKAFAAAGEMPAPPTVVDDASRARLKDVVYTVTEASRQTLLAPSYTDLVATLDSYPDEKQGFAYEGAGVALAALDSINPRQHRVRHLATNHGSRHTFGIYLGAGMCLGRIRRNPEAFRKRLDDPLMGWLILDGYGFYKGFFGYQRHVSNQRISLRVHGYGLRVIDQGIGRAIWFASAGDVDRVAAIIAGFGEHRRADLWSGAGFACGYSGGFDVTELERLPDLAGPLRHHLEVGTAMSARARHLGNNPTEHNERACKAIFGSTSFEASTIVEEAEAGLPDDVGAPTYALWRDRVLRTLQSSC